MGENKKFILFEILVFLIMGLITLLEIYKFDLFEQAFNYLQVTISWFIGISFGFVFMSFLQSMFGGVSKLSAIEKRKEFFSLFLINLVLSASLIAFIKSVSIIFFNSFFIYFHVLFLQWIMLLYITFKLKNNYEISSKYFLTNELIILFYVAIILTFIA